MEFLTAIHFSSLLLEVLLNSFNVKQKYAQLHGEQLIQLYSKVFCEAILSEKKNWCLTPHAFVQQDRQLRELLTSSQINYLLRSVCSFLHDIVLPWFPNETKIIVTYLEGFTFN